MAGIFGNKDEAQPEKEMSCYDDDDNDDDRHQHDDDEERCDCRLYLVFVLLANQRWPVGTFLVLKFYVFSRLQIFSLAVE